jgi:c-di-GMP-binding flagellar brake protein YcgR
MALRRRRLGDRRVRPRFEVVGQLWGALDTTETLTLVDLGRGGALVASPFPLPPDSTQRLRFTFEGDAADVEARVCHVRTEGAGERARYLIGLEFLPMPEAAATRIDRIVNRAWPSVEH